MKLIEVKKALYERIQTQSLDSEALDLFFLDEGTPIQKECELWDYKRDFNDSNIDLGKTIRSICSFHNTFGGFLIYGIEETEKDTVFVPTGTSSHIDIQLLKGSMDRLLNKRIDITHVEVEKEISGELRRYAIILVPQRSSGTPSIATAKDCGDGRKQIFRKDSTFIREGDECIAATLDEHFRFLNSPRNPFEEQKASKRKIIPHNLPDKNFICQEFVGREEIIQSLWAWVSDDFDYVKVLAGEGGKGKTSLAYEFSRLLAKSEPEYFDQILWLTAKLKQFKADTGRFVATPEQHYSDLNTLLLKVCSETGSLDSETAQMPVQLLKRQAKANLESLPSFIVIDDVDSTEPEEQKKILEIARAIANQKSKILLTTRSNNTYSSEIAISVPGLAGKEYDDLVVSLAKRLKIQAPSKNQTESLAKTSNGSPLFTESIFRLVKLGTPIDRAIEDWKDKAGEEVRSAALQREIEQLSNTSKRIMLAATIVGTCSLAELSDITEIEKNTLLPSIEELNSLFLLQSPAIISQEPRFEVSDTTSRLVLSIAEKLVPNHTVYIAKIRNHATSLSLAKDGKSRKGVGAAISQANALLKSEQYDPARNTIKSTLKKPQYKDNPDLLLMLGRIDHCDPAKAPTIAISSFQESYRRGQRKEILFDLWYEALDPQGGLQEKLEVVSFALEATTEGQKKWLNRLNQLHMARVERATIPERKIGAILEAWEILYKWLPRIPGRTLRHSESMERLIDTLYLQETTTKDYTLLIAEAIVHAIKKGDMRTSNFDRCANLLVKLLPNITRKDELKIHGLLNALDYSIGKLKNSTQKKAISQIQERLKNEFSAR